MTRLNATTLGSLPPGAAPDYDRRAVSTGILHLGVGGFHRSHQAMYVDRLLAAGATDWGICGVGTQPLDRRMSEVLGAQDGLYSLLLKHSSGHVDVQVIGSIVDYRYAADDTDAVIERIAAESTKLVTVTITEGGYQVGPDGGFEPAEPAVLLDLERGARPTTVFGLVAAGLARRREHNGEALTIASCDNVQGNGEIARAAFVGFAERRDPALAGWMRQHVAFPSSMVDRITPATSDADVALAADRLGVEDAWPVVAEPFHQWVIEQSPGADLPPWQDVGVHVVSDIRAYELMKLRLLNAGHQAIGYLGYLAGHRYTDEACTDPVFRQFLQDYMAYEASPTLAPVPGVNLADYRHTILERFSNPYIRDTLARLCAESSDRIATFLVPVIREQLRAGRDVTRAALVIAAWARYAQGVDEQGEPIYVVDRLLELVRAAAQAHQDQPAAFLSAIPALQELASAPPFVEVFEQHVRSLQNHGARATVARLLGGAAVL